MAIDRLRTDLEREASTYRDDLKAGRARGMATLSTREAADALGISEQAVRRAIARGALAARKKGRAHRIRQDELDRYAQRRLEARPALPRDKIVALPKPAPGPNLPVPATRFVGRVGELATLVALLRDPAERVVTLTGPGGIGKTRLALAAAAMVRDRFPDGVYFVDLTSVTRPQMVVSVVAQSFGLREHPGWDQHTQLVAFLRDKRVLVVLDNFEQVLEAAPDVARIVANAPDLSVLVTSRAPLRIGGERVLLLPPLSLPRDDADIAALLASDAGRLFVERVRDQDASYAVDDVSAPMIADICARLDGLPLAIELAAARCRLLPPRVLRDRLEARLPVLTSGLRDAPPRLRTMRDAIAWSYNLLSPAEQRCFRRLAVFSGGWTMAAADAVLGNHDADGENTVAVIEQLLDQSLLTTEQGPEGEPRFRMLETIREYGLEHLSCDEEGTSRAAHARYFFEFVQALRPLVNTQATSTVFDRMAADDANLRLALAWLDEHGPAADFVGMVAAGSVYWYALSHLRDAETWIARALTKHDQATASDRARLLMAHGEQLMVQGEYAEAQGVFVAGLSLVRAGGDPFDIAMALITYGVCLTFAGQTASGEAALDEALTAAEAIADPTLRAAVTAGALANLSVTARSRGDLALAQGRSEAALRLQDEMNFDLAAVRSLVDLGEIAREQGDYRLAAEHFLTSIKRTGNRGEKRIIADALTGIAIAVAAWGQSRTALLLFGAADAVRERAAVPMRLPVDSARVDGVLAALQAVMGNQEFQNTLAEGRALSVTEAIALATAICSPGGDQLRAGAAPEQRLTRRERDILNLLSRSLTDREIGEALFLSPRTVNWHMRSILAKLGASTRHDAVERARTAELL